MFRLERSSKNPNNQRNKNISLRHFIRTQTTSQNSTNRKLLHQHFTPCSHIFSTKQNRVRFSIYFDCHDRYNSTINPTINSTINKSTTQKVIITPPCRQRLQRKHHHSHLLHFIFPEVKATYHNKSGTKHTQKRDVIRQRGELFISKN